MSRPFARHATRAAALAAGLAFLLPLAALYLGPSAGWPVRLFVGGLVALSAARPRLGLGALLVLLSTSTELGTELVTPASVADALLLAFVAGASLRLLPPDREPTRLGGPALVLIAAVITSTIVELDQLHAVVPRQPFWSDVWRHLARDFWTETSTFVVLHDAWRWVAGLAAAVYVERLMRDGLAARDWIVRIWLASGAIAGLMTLVLVANLIWVTGSWSPRELFTMALVRRWSALQPDLNAAGSHFALFLVPAIVLAWQDWRRWITFGVLPLVAYGFWAAQSRAALAAVVLVLSAHASVRLLRSRRWRGAAVAIAASAVVLVVLLAVMERTHVSLGTATQVRRDLLTVGLEAAKRFPVFGVGLGDYIRMTRRWITTDTLALFQFAPNGENAHNNFLQILVELGLPACLVFAWMTVSTAVTGWLRPSDDDDGLRQGTALGLAAFLLSAFFGHPLLQPQVFAPFCAALGVTAGLTQRPRSLSSQSLVVQAAALFYGLSLLWRLG